MKQRQKGFLDPYIIDSLVDRGFSARWADIRIDLLERFHVADRTIWEALKRLEKLGLIKKESDRYILIPELPRVGEPFPFQTIKGYSYIQSLKIWADDICIQKNTDERINMLTKYLFRDWANITSLYLYVLEKYVEASDRKTAEEYLNREMMVLVALMTRTTQLLKPPKEPKFPVPENSSTPIRVKISKREVNRARRIIAATLARGIPKDIMAHVDSNLSESDFGYKDCMFNWDEIPGNDSGKLIEILKEDFDVDWVMANIEKIDDGTTIRVSTEKKSLFLKLNDEKTKVNLEIDDGRTYEFTVLKAKDKLNIYYRDFPPRNS